ncbi:MAG: hypothetical protein CM15mP77_2970 [Synechococcus sp.]|nr:MAG: hypothetical protein CM15mP77_2970 [Synechococcus sp.]
MATVSRWSKGRAAHRWRHNGRWKSNRHRSVELKQRFISAMDDDLNSSGGLAVLFDLAKPLRALANRLERGKNAEMSSREI